MATGKLTSSSYGGAYWSFEWTSTITAAGKTRVDWVLYGRGKSSGYYYAHCKVTANYNGTNPTLINKERGKYYYNNVNHGSGSFIVTHDSTGKASFSISIIGNIYSYGDETKSETFNLPTNKPYTVCSAPKNLKYSNIVTPSAGISISWDKATNGVENPVTGYKVYYKTDSKKITNIDTIRTGKSTTVTQPLFSMSISEDNRGKYYNFVKVTIGTVDGFLESSPSSVASIKINSLPNKPTVTPSKTIVPYNKGQGGAVTFSATPGSDSDGQNIQLYYSVAGGSKKAFSSPLNLNISGNSGSSVKYSFYSYDGLEYSSATDKTININTIPEVTLTDNGTSFFNNSDFVNELKINASVKSSELSKIRWFYLVNETENNLGQFTNLVLAGKAFPLVGENKSFKIGLEVIDKYGDNKKVVYATTFYTQKSPKNLLNVIFDNGVSEIDNKYLGDKIEIKWDYENNDGTYLPLSKIEFYINETQKGAVTLTENSEIKNYLLDVSSVTPNNNFTIKSVITDIGGAKTSQTFGTDFIRVPAPAFAPDAKIEQNPLNWHPHKDSNSELIVTFTSAVTPNFSNITGLIYGYNIQCDLYNGNNFIMSIGNLFEEPNNNDNNENTQITFISKAEVFETLGSTYNEDIRVVYTITSTNNLGTTGGILTKEFTWYFIESPILTTDGFTTNIKIMGREMEYNTNEFFMVNEGDTIYFNVSPAEDPNDDVEGYEFQVIRSNSILEDFDETLYESLAVEKVSS